MLKLGLGRKRGMFYPPAKPIINPLSPQAQGLIALLTVADLTGGAPAVTAKASYWEAVSGRWLDDDIAGSVLDISVHNNAVLGPFLGIVDGTAGGNIRKAVTITSNAWKDDEFSIALWLWTYHTDNQGQGITGLGTPFGDGVAIFVDSGNASAWARYDGTGSPTISTQFNTGRYIPHLVVATFDESDFMRFYADGTWISSDAMDHATYGDLSAVTKSFHGRTFCPTGLLESRYYNRVLQPDEIWQMWSPETRWDLYRQPNMNLDVTALTGIGKISLRILRPTTQDQSRLIAALQL